MSPLTRNKIILYLAIIFAAGGVTGTVITWGSAKRKMIHPPSMERVCSDMQDRFKAKLGLNPEQVRKIQPILDQTTQEIQAIHGRTMEQIDQVIRRAHEEIAKELNPDQQEKLKEMDNQRCEFMQGRPKPRPASPR
jgi:hypothetical protein